MKLNKFLKIINEEEIKMFKESELTDYGWENGWYPGNKDITPKIIKDCYKKKHGEIPGAKSRTDEGSTKYRGLDTVTRCFICGYKYHTDSSD